MIFEDEGLNAQQLEIKQRTVAAEIAKKKRKEEHQKMMEKIAELTASTICFRLAASAADLVWRAKLALVSSAACLFYTFGVVPEGQMTVMGCISLMGLAIAIAWPFLVAICYDSFISVSLIMGKEPSYQIFDKSMDWYGQVSAQEGRLLFLVAVPLTAIASFLLIMR